MTRTKHPWPLVDVALVTADWDDGLDIATHAAAAQRLSDWQHAWAQASAELRGLVSTLGDVSFQQTGRATMLEIADWWEQRAKEQQP